MGSCGRAPRAHRSARGRLSEIPETRAPVLGTRVQGRERGSPRHPILHERGGNAGEGEEARQHLELGWCCCGRHVAFVFARARFQSQDQAHAKGPHRGCHERKILRPVSWLRQEKREMHAPLWAQLPGAPLGLLRPADPTSRRPCQPLPLGQPRPLPSAPPTPLSASGLGGGASGRGGGRGPEAAAAAAAVLVAAPRLLGRSWLRT